jgi:hypothetical protein
LSEHLPEKPTKSASGSQTGSLFEGLITQSRWRVAGALTTAGAALMAWYGAENRFFTNSLSLFLSYWGFFFVLLVITFYIVMLDIRYIHLQYKIHQRELLHQTLADESFRREIIEAQKKNPMRERE